MNIFGRFSVYGLAKLQRDSKYSYSIACAHKHSRNLFIPAQHFLYVQITLIALINGIIDKQIKACWAKIT